MAAYALELYDSRELTEGEGAAFKYVVLGTADELEAFAAVQEEAPETYQGINRGRIRVAPLGGLSWMADVPYTIDQPPTADSSAGNNPGGGGLGEDDGNQDPEQLLPLEYSFSSGGGTTKVLRSQFTVAAVAAGDFPPTYPTPSLDATAANLNGCPNYHRLINVTDQGVEGVDVESPQSSFTITKEYLFLKHGWFVSMHNLVGRTNQVGWRGFKKREVLYCGCDGSPRGGESGIGWKVVHKFKFQPSEGFAAYGYTVTDPTDFLGMIAVGEETPELYIPEKFGWDYLWVRRIQTSKTVDGKEVIVEVPKFAYVERVYKTGDFSVLGLDL